MPRAMGYVRLTTNFESFISCGSINLEQWKNNFFFISVEVIENNIMDFECSSPLMKFLQCH